jgi:hypothetical protein
MACYESQMFILLQLYNLKVPSRVGRHALRACASFLHLGRQHLFCESLDHYKQEA